MCSSDISPHNLLCGPLFAGFSNSVGVIRHIFAARLVASYFLWNISSQILCMVIHRIIIIMHQYQSCTESFGKSKLAIHVYIIPSHLLSISQLLPFGLLQPLALSGSFLLSPVATSEVAVIHRISI